MRQVRRAQGKDMSRVERLWVITDGAKPRAEILPGIEGTRLARYFGERRFLASLSITSTSSTPRAT